MASVCETIVCDDNCEDELPAVSFTLCAPEINFGEIDAIFMTNIGNPLTDETSAAEWAVRLAAIDDTKMIELYVVGEKPVPEEQEVVTSRNITVTGQKTHTIPFEIHQTNHTNYEFMRSLECNRQVLIWYRTAGGKLYGGKSGISATVKLNHLIPKTRKEITMFVGTAKWDAKFHPCECPSPI